MNHSITDSFILGLFEFIVWARWLFLLAVILTLGDLKFGIAASRFRKEKFKRSRAVRRTLDKLSGYLIWVVLAYTFGQAFGRPFGIDLLPLLILLVIYVVELESIFVNYFGSTGRKIKIHLSRFFGKKIDNIIEFEEEKKEDEKD